MGSQIQMQLNRTLSLLLSPLLCIGLLLYHLYHPTDPVCCFHLKKKNLSFFLLFLLVISIILISRSFLCPALFSQLFITVRLIFTMAIELTLNDSSIVFSYMLQLYMLILRIFINPFSIFIMS